ncbi:hypothetical protein M0811_11430 [Anaeramoeba ignava]|uniref:PH domain-containing protein n=1 Tax=Anaeramoeba ignava TaxID=1746090 RepID=A0A9Q0LC05_ANAIG|nr:hypothetical protein M0811_11430 [Anaeramoeba ignava]
MSKIPENPSQNQIPKSETTSNLNSQVEPTQTDPANTKGNAITSKPNQINLKEEKITGKNAPTQILKIGNLLHYKEKYKIWKNLPFSIEDNYLVCLDLKSTENQIKINLQNAQLKQIRDKANTSLGFEFQLETNQETHKFISDKKSEFNSWIKNIKIAQTQFKDQNETKNRNVQRFIQSLHKEKAIQKRILENNDSIDTSISKNTSNTDLSTENSKSQILDPNSQSKNQNLNQNLNQNIPLKNKINIEPNSAQEIQTIEENEVNNEQEKDDLNLDSDSDRESNLNIQPEPIKPSPKKIQLPSFIPKSVVPISLPKPKDVTTETVPAPLDVVYQVVYHQNETFLKQYMDKIENTNLVMKEWNFDDPQRIPKRDILYTTPLNGGPFVSQKTADVVEHQRVFFYSEDEFLVEFHYDIVKAPYSDSFSVYSIHEIKKVSENSTSIHIYCDTIFRKSVLLKKIIEKKSISAHGTSMKHWIDTAKQETEKFVELQNQLQNQIANESDNNLQQQDLLSQKSPQEIFPNPQIQVQNIPQKTGPSQEEIHKMQIEQQSQIQSTIASSIEKTFQISFVAVLLVFAFLLVSFLFSYSNQSKMNRNINDLSGSLANIQAKIEKLHQISTNSNSSNHSNHPQIEDDIFDNWIQLMDMFIEDLENTLTKSSYSFRHSDISLDQIHKSFDSLQTGKNK